MRRFKFKFKLIIITLKNKMTDSFVKLTHAIAQNEAHEKNVSMNLGAFLDAPSEDWFFNQLNIKFYSG